MWYYLLCSSSSPLLICEWKSEAMKRPNRTFCLYATGIRVGAVVVLFIQQEIQHNPFGLVPICSKKFDLLKRNRNTMREHQHSKSTERFHSHPSHICVWLPARGDRTMKHYKFYFPFVLRLWTRLGGREFIKCADLNIWLVSVFIPASCHCPLAHMVWIFSVRLLSRSFFSLLGYFYFFSYISVTFSSRRDGRTHTHTFYLSSLLFQ